ncbi:hypothetical protein QR680_010847 [Steinernema hermaphroditum]|uniref:F-box domain-containing protein n=1 Tax=Steinernema hermaphroditum TaxID=289476 RepID=A0AA39MC84_9BILA|nr:hypothetical protein QR680_010847 [Steinernema hermaphroditum]
MDSVPYEFCQEVVGLLNMKKEKCRQAAEHLTGSWKMAVEKYAENVRHFGIAVWKGDEDQWFCKITERMNRNMESSISLEELYSIDRRFVKICDVTVREEDYGDVFLPKPIGMSKEHLIEILIPFLNAQSLSSCTLSISVWSAECMAIFKPYVVFGHLALPSGIPLNHQDVEDFLETQIEKNCILKIVQLSFYSHSERLEQILIDLVKKPSHTRLEIIGPGALMVTMRIVNAVFKMWHETGKKTEIQGETNVTEEDLLSMPLPAGVKRIAKCAKTKNETTHIFLWTQEDRPDLKCKLVVKDDRAKEQSRTVYINNPLLQYGRDFQGVLCGERIMNT